MEYSQRHQRINGHIQIGAGARVGAQAGVFNDVEPGADVIGWPARERRGALRKFAALERLPEFLERLRALEARSERNETARAETPARDEPEESHA